MRWIGEILCPIRSESWRGCRRARRTEREKSEKKLIKKEILRVSRQRHPFFAIDQKDEKRRIADAKEEVPGQDAGVTTDPQSLPERG